VCTGGLPPEGHTRFADGRAALGRVDQAPQRGRGALGQLRVRQQPHEQRGRAAVRRRAAARLLGGQLSQLPQRVVARAAEGGYLCRRTLSSALPW